MTFTHNSLSTLHLLHNDNSTKGIHLKYFHINFFPLQWQCDRFFFFFFFPNLVMDCYWNPCSLNSVPTISILFCNTFLVRVLNLKTKIQLYFKTIVHWKKKEKVRGLPTPKFVWVIFFLCLLKGVSGRVQGKDHVFCCAYPDHVLHHTLPTTTYIQISTHPSIQSHHLILIFKKKKKKRDKVHFSANTDSVLT